MSLINTETITKQKKTVTNSHTDTVFNVAIDFVIEIAADKYSLSNKS